MAYKPAVGDIRESPSLKIIDRLQSLGGEVVYHDAYVPALPQFGLTSVSLDEAVENADVAVIVTAHPGIDHMADRRVAADASTSAGSPAPSRAAARPPHGNVRRSPPGSVDIERHGGGGMKRLMIVADHSFVVQAIRLALRQTAGFQVVGFVDGRGSVRHAARPSCARTSSSSTTCRSPRTRWPGCARSPRTPRTPSRCC